MNQMEKKIEIEVLWESKDVWRQHLNLYFSYDSIIVFFLTFAIYGIFLAFLVLNGNANFLNLMDVVWSAFLFVILFGLIMSYFSAKNAKKTKQEKYKFIFSSEKVEINGDSSCTQFNWTHVRQVKENRKYFILFLKSEQRSFLPKRFFRDYEQLEDFKNLLRLKLGEKVYLKKSKETLGLK